MQTLQFNYLFSHTRFLTASLTSCPRTLTLCILVRLALSSSGVITDILTPRSSLHLVHLQAICQFVRPLLNHINGKLTLGLTSGLRRIRVVLVQKQMDRNLRDLPFGRAKLHSKRQASRAISFLFCFLFFKWGSKRSLVKLRGLESSLLCTTTRNLLQGTEPQTLSNSWSFKLLCELEHHVD